MTCSTLHSATLSSSDSKLLRKYCSNINRSPASPSPNRAPFPILAFEGLAQYTCYRVSLAVDVLPHLPWSPHFQGVSTACQPRTSHRHQHVHDRINPAHRHSLSAAMQSTLSCKAVPWCHGRQPLLNIYREPSAVVIPLVGISKQDPALPSGP